MFWVFFTSIAFVIVVFGGFGSLFTTSSSIAMSSGVFSGVTAFVVDNWLLFALLFFGLGIVALFAGGRE